MKKKKPRRKMSVFRVCLSRWNVSEKIFEKKYANCWAAGNIVIKQKVQTLERKIQMGPFYAKKFQYSIPGIVNKKPVKLEVITWKAPLNEASKQNYVNATAAKKNNNSMKVILYDTWMPSFSWWKTWKHTTPITGESCHQYHWVLDKLHGLLTAWSPIFRFK